MATAASHTHTPRRRLVAFVLIVMFGGIAGFTLGRWLLRRDVRNAMNAIERRVKALESRAAVPAIVVRMPAETPAPSGQQSEENHGTQEQKAEGPVVAPLFVPIVQARGPAAVAKADSGAGIEADGGAAPPATAEVAEHASAAQPREPEEPRPVSCGASWCSPGLVCCNADCGLCAPPGVACSQRMCSVIAPPMSVLCGMSTCNVGDVCCNPSCGTCVRAGQTCDPTPCDSSLELPFSEMCGMTTCNTGFECCNPTCGTCARPGDPCSKEPCIW